MPEVGIHRGRAHLTLWRAAMERLGPARVLTDHQCVAAGATLNDIVKTNTYVTNIEEFFKHTDVRMEYFGAMPTSTSHTDRDAASGSTSTVGLVPQIERKSLLKKSKPAI
jgi:enamine deaminase RidA (YjgF/YER057c/UK114 family)